MGAEEEVQAEKVILIDIRLTRGLVVVLAVLLTLAADTAAPQVISDGMLQFYLSENTALAN